MEPLLNALLWGVVGALSYIGLYIAVRLATAAYFKSKSQFSNGKEH